MRTTLCLALVLLCCGCSVTTVLEQKENKVGSLTSADEYLLRPLTVSFKVPESWGTTPEQWDAWLGLWRSEYERALRENCRKTLTNTAADAKPDKGYVVECDVYEMDSGGFAGVGGKGYARCRLYIYDAANNNVLYDGKIEGQATSQTKAADRLTGAIGDLAEQVAVILMQGG